MLAAGVRGRRMAGTLLLGLLCIASPLPAAERSTSTEDQVKAAFLLNFPKYIDWPPALRSDEQDAIILTVIGDRHLEEALRRMAEGKLYNGRTLEVRSAASFEEISSSSMIVFLGAAERRRIPELLAHARARPLLTVSESDDFLAAGGMINLARRDRKICMEVNLPPADAAGLKISSRLLSVAAVVQR